MKLKEYRGILLPSKMKVDSWIVVGPPGSGKSYLIDKIAGYPNEVAIDISEKKWWTVEPLTHRPREIHLALPFKGFDGGLSVYDDKWKGLKEYPDLDFKKIKIPKKKKFIMAPNWRARFVFDFVLPPPKWLYENRQKRQASEDRRLVDIGLTPEWVAWQVHTYWRIAWYFHQAGLQVMLRPFNTARPYSFPLLKKLYRKKDNTPRSKISPELDWSKVSHVKLWLEKSSPDNWDMEKWEFDEG